MYKYISTIHKWYGENRQFPYAKFSAAIFDDIGSGVDVERYFI